MKIESGRGVGPASTTRKASSAAGAGFAPAADAPARTASAAPAGAAHSLDAILALQAEGVDPERRRRQMRRGAAALDALDGLVRALALGTAPASLKAELEAARRAAEATGEPALDALLREIDIRVAVELAKLERANTEAA